MTHNLPKKTESWHFTANHSSNSVTRVDSNSGENSWKQRWFITHLTNFSHKCQRQSGYFRSMLISIFTRNSRDDHVLVINCFYFVNIKIVNQSLQFFVYIIQVIPWLKWCQMLCYVSDFLENSICRQVLSKKTPKDRIICLRLWRASMVVWMLVILISEPTAVLPIKISSSQL